MTNSFFEIKLRNGTAGLKCIHIKIYYTVKLLLAFTRKIILLYTPILINFNFYEYFVISYYLFSLLLFLMNWSYFHLFIDYLYALCWVTVWKKSQPIIDHEPKISQSAKSVLVPFMCGLQTEDVFIYIFLVVGKNIQRRIIFYDTYKLHKI